MTTLTTSEITILDLAVKWSLLANGVEKTMEMANDGSLFAAYMADYDAFCAKASKLTTDDLSDLAERIYFKINDAA